MKNIFLKQFMLITVGILTVFSCDYDPTSYDALTDHAPDPNSTYYVQFKENAKSLKVVVVPATGVTVTEISTKIVVAIAGLPRKQDVIVKLNVDASSTATPNMYVLGSTTITIPSGSVSASTTLKSVSANMPVGEPVNLVLTIDSGENTATFGTTLNYEMLRPAPCLPVPGDYKVKMFDSFGDGWQTTNGDAGDGIQVTIKDASGNESIVEVGMCSYWDDSTFACTAWPDDQAPGACGADYCFKGPIEATVTIPDGSTKMTWHFPGDAFGEIKFEVISPSGVQLYSSGDFGDLDAGIFEVVNCL